MTWNIVRALKLIMYVVCLFLIAYFLVQINGWLAFAVEGLWVIFTMLPEKIRSFIFGKQVETPIDSDSLGKVIVESMHKDAMYQKLENKLKDHYHELVEEIYEKWFERSASSPIFSEVVTEYSISLAKITYQNGKIRTKELEEPLHQNKRLVEEAIEHLKYYETWALWADAKTQTKETLVNVEELWNNLLRDLVNKLVSSCPQLVEWHGYGSKQTNYHSLRNTFQCLWVCVQSISYLDTLQVGEENERYNVGDLAESSDRKTMKQFIQVISDLAKDSSIQAKMMSISTQKRSIEANLEKFRESLSLIADDVKRGDKRLDGSCPTCEHWLDELPSFVDLKRGEVKHSDLDQRFEHVYAILFFPKEVSWEKGERVPSNPKLRYKYVINRKTHKAFYMLEVAWSLLQPKVRIQYYTQTFKSEKNCEDFLKNIHVRLIKDYVPVESDLLATENPLEKLWRLLMLAIRKW